MAELPPPRPPESRAGSLPHTLSNDTPDTPCENCRLLTVQVARLMAVHDQIAYLISATYVTEPRPHTDPLALAPETKVC